MQIIKRSFLDNTLSPVYEVFGTASDFEEAVAKVKRELIADYGVTEDEIADFFSENGKDFVFQTDEKQNIIFFDDILNNDTFEYFVY